MSDSNTSTQAGARRRGRTRLLLGAGLLVAVAALVILLIWVRNRPPSAPAAGEPPPEKPELSRFDIERIVAVRLERQARQELGGLALTRIADGWEVADDSGVIRGVPWRDSAIQDVLYSFASLYAERVIDEQPSDLGAYGLDPPQAVATATLDDGTTVQVLLGARTPAGNTWYLRTADAPTVYSVWINHGNHYLYTVDDLRGDALGTINGEAVNYLRLHRPDGSILEVVETNPIDQRFRALMTRLAVVQPYRVPRGIDSEKWTELTGQIAGVAIDRIVTDDPAAAAQYGLDPPRYELVARDAEGAERHLLFGAQRDGEVFLQMPGRATVYAMDDHRGEFLRVRPFELVDKFLLIVNIQLVDAVQVTQPEGSNTLQITRTGSGDDEQETFALDGTTMEDKPARELYQLIIGLLADAELPAEGRARLARAEPEITVSYELDADGEQRLTLGLVPYDRQFYAAVREGVAEMMVSRAQVQRMLDGLGDALEVPAAAATTGGN